MGPTMSPFQVNYYIRLQYFPPFDKNLETTYSTLNLNTHILINCVKNIILPKLIYN